MIIADLSGKRRRETVALALDFVLQDLTAPCATFDVVELLCKRLDTAERLLLSRTVVALAPLYPEAAQGPEFKKYGRGMRRWIWSPKGKATPGPALAAAEDEWSVVAPAASKEAWTDEQFDAYLASHPEFRKRLGV